MKKQLKSIFHLFACGTLLLNVACKKQTYRSESKDTSLLISPNLNGQEQTMLGSWVLKKTETYEVSGVDSNGVYLCSLVSTENCDSVCKMEFKDECATKNCDSFRGIGVIGGCDANASLSWRAKQTGELEIISGSTYDIVYANKDSMALSNVYAKDILTLRSIFYYKRK